MTSRQMTVVAASFRQIEPTLEEVTNTFYQRLFDIDPWLRTSLPTPRGQQAAVVAQALTAILKGMGQPDRLKPAIQALGRKHAGRGLRHHHYATAGSALLWTLERALGPAFTPAVRAAWAGAYGWIAFTMRKAAAEADMGCGIAAL